MSPHCLHIVQDHYFSTSSVLSIWRTTVGIAMEPDGARLSDVAICRQLSQKGWVVFPEGAHGRPCDARDCVLRLSLKESEMGQSIEPEGLVGNDCGPAPMFVGCLHLLRARLQGMSS